MGVVGVTNFPDRFLGFSYQWCMLFAYLCIGWLVNFVTFIKYISLSTLILYQCILNSQQLWMSGVWMAISRRSIQFLVALLVSMPQNMFINHHKYFKSV